MTIILVFIFRDGSVCKKLEAVESHVQRHITDDDDDDGGLPIFPSLIECLHILFSLPVPLFNSPVFVHTLTSLLALTFFPGLLPILLLFSYCFFFFYKISFPPTHIVFPLFPYLLVIFFSFLHVLIFFLFIFILHSLHTKPNFPIPHHYSEQHCPRIDRIPNETLSSTVPADIAFLRPNPVASDDISVHKFEMTPLQ